VTARLTHIDLLRVALTAGVIATHAIITYGGPGSWFIRDGELPSALEAVATLPIAFGALFGMGAFFFIAGAFLPGSLDRRGPRRFVVSRLNRLGWPLLVFVLVVVPLTHWAVRAVTGTPRSFGTVVTEQLRELDPGPLWFVWVLLLFSLLAVPVLRSLPPARPVPLRPALLVWCGVAIAVASFAFRVFFPLDSEQIGGAKLWQWGQCAGLFVLGIVAGRQGWLTAIPATVRRAAGWAALAAGITVVASIAITGVEAEEFRGGRHWQSALLATCEGVLCVSVTLLLVDLFRGVTGGEPLIRGAYGAYLLQTPVLVGLTIMLYGVAWPAAAKLAVVLPVAVAACFALALLLLRVPGLRRVL
jgi:peptidoglycan/LPS O-acetylase OafA/YrhL